MNVRHIFVNTHKYDFRLAKICIASIRYWYPDIPIFLIKDSNSGNFNCRIVEKYWNVETFDFERKTFGWGYGKLEPIFLEDTDSFLVLDSDTVLTGPILSKVLKLSSQFVVDEEIQPQNRFNEIYYDLKRINEINDEFKYPGYSFNTGQWFGTSGILTRNDFSGLIYWDSIPKPKFPTIFFNGEQGILNYILQSKNQENKISISRIKLMIWPSGGNADYINLTTIKNKQGDYQNIIHWAGIKVKKIKDLPRGDILLFYQLYFYSKLPFLLREIDKVFDMLIFYKHQLNLYINQRAKKKKSN